jgi:site-specific recombinase XerD
MKLEDRFTAEMLSAGNKRSSIKAYWRHVASYIQFTRKRYRRWVHPSKTDVEDVYAWRRHLAANLHLSPQSQNQAVSAIKFLFARVLGQPIIEHDGKPLRAREAARCRRRVVAKSDLVKLFKAFRATDRLVWQLMYASVLRLSDTINLRVKELQK